MIKVQQRAILTPDFKKAVKDAAYNRLHKLHNDYSQMSSGMKKALVEKNGSQIAILKAIVSDAGKQDQLWARLRMLPYTEYAVEEWDGTTYLRGTTKDIVVVEDQLNLGPYWVYVNVNDYVFGVTEDMHFVPTRDPLNGHRFFHHYADGPRRPGWDYIHELPKPRTLELTHHLDALAHTCWGSFGAFATTAFEVMDTAELFRTLQVYLSRHNNYSNLWNKEMVGYNDGYSRVMTLSFARPA